MSDNPSQSPQISHSANNPNSPSIDLPPLPPQSHNNSSNALQNLRQMSPQQQQHIAAMLQRNQQYGSGGAQMNFGQAGQRIGQPGQGMSMLPGQTLAQFNNMQAQILLQQSRPKANLSAQGMQFNPSNSSAQGLQSFQGMGIINSFGMNQQIRANGQLPYGQQMSGQSRQQQQQQLTMQNSLASPQKLQGQPLQRGSSLSSINTQFPGLNQNGQSTTIQNVLGQQPWMKPMQSVSSPISPSNHIQQQQLQRQQQQVFSPQQSPSSQAMNQKPIGFTQQQLAQLVQRQSQSGSTRQHQPSQYNSLQQLQLLQQFQQHHQQQQQQPSPRTQVSSGHQKNIAFSGSQPGTPVSVNTNTGGNSSQGADAGSQLLGKRKIQDLVSQVDPNCKLDPAVEDLLLEIADDFIDSVTTFACSLAKHRKSSNLEPKDVLLHLEKNLHLTIPGYTKDGQKYQNGLLTKDIHTERLESIRASIESQQLERSAGKQGIVTDSALNGPLKPSPSSEQLIHSAAASQMLHKAPRFS